MERTEFSWTPEHTCIRIPCIKTRTLALASNKPGAQFSTSNTGVQLSAPLLACYVTLGKYLTSLCLSFLFCEWGNDLCNLLSGVVVKLQYGALPGVRPSPADPAPHGQPHGPDQGQSKCLRCAPSSQALCSFPHSYITGWPTACS